MIVGFSGIEWPSGQPVVAMNRFFSFFCSAHREWRPSAFNLSLNEGNNEEAGRSYENSNYPGQYQSDDAGSLGNRGPSMLKCADLDQDAHLNIEGPRSIQSRGFVRLILTGLGRNAF